MIHAVLDLFANLDGFEKVLNEHQINSIKDILGELLIDKIREIAEEFKNYHETMGYKALKKLFPAFGQKMIELKNKKKLENFNIYTTNYDGILDTLLTDNPRGFLFSDGFIKSDFYDGLLKIVPDFVNGDKPLMANLHGSYLYQKFFGVTYKQRRRNTNNNPVMVFNNPDLKEKIIK